MNFFCNNAQKLLSHNEIEQARAFRVNPTRQNADKGSVGKRIKIVYSSDSSGESNSPQQKPLKLAKHSTLHRLSGISDKQQGGPKLSTLGITVVANEFPQQLQSMYKRQKTDISRKPSSPTHS